MSTELDTTGLTAEEIAALSEPDTEEELTATQGELQEKAGAAGATDEDDDADDENKDPSGDDTGAAAAADDGAAAAAKADGDQSAGADAEPAATPSAAQSAPILVAEAPADAEAKLADIKAKKDSVIERFDDGDITAKEMQAELDALGKQEREIERAIDKAQIAKDLEEQRKRNEWSQQCDAFLVAHPEYDGGKGERFEHLNAMLKAIAVMPQNAGLTGPQLLEKAHKLALADRGEAAPAPKADPKPAKQAIPKPQLPPNLAGVPAASSNDPGEGKWASLDRLRDSGNGTAYEAALAKMSQAERDAYLQA